jgi:hypothetical protein
MTLNLSFIEASNQLKFKVQCASSNQNLSADLLKKMPELKMYILPSGLKLFFWKGFYDELNLAEETLIKVREIGFRNACIRVFNGDVLLSKIEGDKYISSLKEKPIALSEKLKLKKETKVIETTIKKRKKDSIKINIIKPLKIQPEILEEHIVIKSEVPIEPSKMGGEAGLVNSSMVPYPPVFRIYLTSVSEDSLVPSVIADLKNETIYMFKQNSQKYYLVGTFENHQEAFGELQKYKSIISSASVVAEFRARVISLDLAVELYERYHNLPRRY